MQQSQGRSMSPSTSQPQEEQSLVMTAGSPILRSAGVKIVFGEHVLDPDRRELTRGSEAIADAARTLASWPRAPATDGIQT
mgnify:CR=1 FL=1